MLFRSAFECVVVVFVVFECDEFLDCGFCWFVDCCEGWFWWFAFECLVYFAFYLLWLSRVSMSCCCGSFSLVISLAVMIVGVGGCIRGVWCVFGVW